MKLPEKLRNILEDLKSKKIIVFYKDEENWAAVYPILQPFIHLFPLALSPDWHVNKDGRTVHKTTSLHKFLRYLTSKKAEVKHYNVSKVILDILQTVDKIGPKKLWNSWRQLRGTPLLVDSEDVDDFITMLQDSRNQLSSSPLFVIALLEAILEYDRSFSNYRVPKQVPQTIRTTSEILSKTSTVTLYLDGQLKLFDFTEHQTPEKWGIDEYILLFDVLMRKYQMCENNCRTIFVVHHKASNSLIRELSQKGMVITSKSIRDLTAGLVDKHEASRILKKFPNLTETLIGRVKTPKGTIEVGYHLVTLSRTGIEWLTLTTSQTEEKISIYEFTDIALQFFEEVQAGQYTLSEGALFARLKNALPRKSRGMAARFANLLLLKGHPAIIPLSQMAEAIGKSKLLEERGWKGGVREHANAFLSKLIDAGVIEKWYYDDKRELYVIEW